MQPNRDISDRMRDALRERPAWTGTQPSSAVQSSAALPGRVRSEESWVEVSSQPSSSSLSSAADEIVTTGLRVQHDSNTRRRRRMRRTGADQFLIGAQTHSAGGSSQEEYDESESESDRVMTSSNEGLQPSPLRQNWQPARALSSASSEDYDEDDEDENATAINAPRSSEPCFTPQPHAFNTNPTQGRPQFPHQHHSSAGSYFPANRPSTRPSPRHAYSSSQPHQHSPYNIISPSHQADHDAALRASLSTLLSCAAAARGLPKSNKSPPAATRPSYGRVDPTSLRLVPESVALGESPARPSSNVAEPGSGFRTPSSGSRSPSVDKGKRKAAAGAGAAQQQQQQRSNSKDRRVAKKARRGGPPGAAGYYSMDDVSPTLLTWVVSAGVVVLVSALSFSAGYVVGREAGRVEGVGEVVEGAGDAARCGREVLRGGAMGGGGAGLGLRRLRLGSAGTSVRV